MKTSLIIYIIWNLIVFLIYGLDKAKSKRNAWRIPEKTLVGAAVLFGGAGAFFGMEIFRHKTKHRSFLIIVPLCMIVQVYYVFTELI